MKSLGTALVAFAASLFVAPASQAAYCPVAPSCSTTTASSCKCPKGTYSGTWTHKFKTVSLNLNNECRKGARKAEKDLEKRYKGRDYRCTYRKIKSRVKNILGYKSGYCRFKLTCNWTTRKTCRTVHAKGPIKTYRGSHKYKFKGWKSKSVCKEADKAAKRHIASKYKCTVTSFKRESYKYKRRNTLGYKSGYCSIRYTIKCQAKVPKRCCSCSGK